MDMYQKREQRKKKKSEDKNNTESTNKTNINWDIGIYRQLTSNPYKIKDLAK